MYSPNRVTKKEGTRRAAGTSRGWSTTLEWELVKRGKRGHEAEDRPNRGQEVDGLANTVHLSYLLSLFTSTTAVGKHDDNDALDDILAAFLLLLILILRFVLVIALLSCHYASQNWTDIVSRFGAGHRPAALVDRG